MSFAFVQCPDGHRCGNGSQCVEVEKEEGTYTCDCDAIADDSNVFAGLSCEHQATVFCNDDNTISKNSFCTNFGTCTKLVTDQQAHFACNCRDEYKGDHCEFTATAQLPNHALESITGNKGSGGGGGGLSGGAVAVIVLVVVGIVLAAGLFYIRKRGLRQWDDSTSDSHKDSVRAAPDLVLDADGSVLSGAVKSGSGVNTPASNGNGLPENVPVSGDSLVSPTSVSSNMENGLASSPPSSSSSVPPPPPPPVSTPSEHSTPATPTTPHADAAAESASPQTENDQAVFVIDDAEHDKEDEPTEPEIV